MKISYTQEFNAPIDIVIRARDERFQNLEKIPNLKPQKIIERKEEGNLVKTKREFEAAKSGGMPPMLKGFISPEMFKFTETAVWDKATCIHKWEIAPAKFAEKFEWKGETKYEEKIDKNNQKKTVRTIKGVIRVKIPFAGDALEKMIEAGFKKSMEKDYNTIVQMANMLLL